MTPIGAEDLLRAGPLLLFVMAVAETAVPAGLVVPAGVAFSTGVFLAHRGLLSWEGVVAAAVCGALVGDSLGYWLGRRSSSLVHRVPGGVGRVVRSARRRTARIFGSHALLAVSVGRTISFVRTFMPATAGASGVPYLRFLAFDGVGVAAWAILYTALGLGAAESWRALAGSVGPGGAAGLLFVVMAILSGVLVWRGWKGGAGAGGSRRPLHVGLTGNVASGKSSVARLWARRGVPVVSADELARRASAPGSAGLAEIVRAFGEGVVGPGGSLDRAALRDVVFRDEERRRRLEAILHPRIAELRDRWVREHQRARLIVSEVPLLFEADLFEEFDRVVVVDAPRSERRRRLVEERGLDPDEADRIIDAQGDPAEKRRRAHHVLDNRGTHAELEGAALRLLDELEAVAERGGADP